MTAQETVRKIMKEICRQCNDGVVCTMCRLEQMDDACGIVATEGLSISAAVTRAKHGEFRILREANEKYDREYGMPEGV